jgi:hypothetical protein
MTMNRHLRRLLMIAIIALSCAAFACNETGGGVGVSNFGGGSIGGSRWEGGGTGPGVIVMGGGGPVYY